MRSGVNFRRGRQNADQTTIMRSPGVFLGTTSLVEVSVLRARDLVRQICALMLFKNYLRME